MVENHKDKVVQKQEEAEAIRKRKNKKMNNGDQENDQVHKYVHGGMLHRNTIEARNKSTQGSVEQVQQNTLGKENEQEEDIDTQ
eukprot:9577329-Heterocapsa_arctica.AAC.1